METLTAGSKRADRLYELGFKRAATELSELLKNKRKLAIAYEHYRFVTRENISKFNEALKKKSGKNLNNPMKMEYQMLVFSPIEIYSTVPPDEVLVALETAQKRECFDSFEIAYIQDVKDPLLFGCINATPNKFFIAQWDNDVKIDDLIKENEG